MAGFHDAPLVGISVGCSEGWIEGGSTYEAYAQVIRDAGATPIPVGAAGDTSLQRCDGLLIPGGWDLHPRHYLPPSGDESLSPEEIAAKYNVQTEEGRDEPELALISEALASDTPLLAICRGFQSLNVALARKLVPDIYKCIPGSLTHDSQPAQGLSLTHPVTIAPGSIMRRVYCTDEMAVNTRHHQGVTAEMVADILRVTALAPDGVVEAVEGVGHRFLVGVQWHPERRADADVYERSRPLFEAFVLACRRG